MATVTHLEPVVVCHPESQQFVTLAKGMEFDDDSSIVKTFGWAFERPVERATAAPGEKRSVGRPKASA